MGKESCQEHASQMAKRVGHSLELTAFLRDREVPLHEVLEFGVEDQGTSFLVADEQANLTSDARVQKQKT
jgi:hypothetical protein